MYSQEMIDKLNSEIPYTDGKIFWHTNKGWTSKQVQYFIQCGWQITKEGAKHVLKDDKGSEVTSAFTFPVLLKNAAILMQ